MKANLTLLTTPQTVTRGQVVNATVDDSIVPFEVVWITNKTLSLRNKENREKKVAFWSERKGRYAIEGKHIVC